ncbi:MAG: membrane protein insertion efficiency factor YidD [Pseudomonadota bacterium]|nr:membrane protein insertion efficiency factor YidD [Pseudomonadota bacterium]
MRGSQKLNLFAKILIGGIEVYQKFFSPFFAPRCRFLPSCSEYALCAIRKYGALRGILMALKRFVRCRPFGGAGYDPVP